MSASFRCHFPLLSGRVHEVLGPSAVMFAALAAPAQGPFFWVREAWCRDSLNPVGLMPALDPANLFLAHPPTALDALAVTEEALKDGAVEFVVLEVTRPLNLREGRRLQLAAAAGNCTGLCIIPEGMGSNAAQTRWHTRPVFGPERADLTLMRWEIIKNKSGTLGAWHVICPPQTRRVHVVSPAPERPGSAGAPG